MVFSQKTKCFFFFFFLDVVYFYFCDLSFISQISFCSLLMLLLNLHCWIGQVCI